MTLQQPWHSDTFFVITGGPGAGKTTLLNALARKHYRCVPEAAREIIQEQLQSGGTALPWKDTALYTRLMLERSVSSYIETFNSHLGNEPVFFDRGIPDTLCYAQLINLGISEAMDLNARQFTYNSKVFLLPPWQEIYQTDTERKQTWEEAVRTYEKMVATYRLYNYQIIEIPKADIETRLAFLLSHIPDLLRK